MAMRDHMPTIRSTPMDVPLGDPPQSIKDAHAARAGLVCAHEGCTTKLNVYDAGSTTKPRTRCYLHDH